MDPDHKAFIRPAFSNVRLVNIPIIREQDIPRPQLIGAAFDAVGHLAGQEKENLIERMLMEIHLGRNNVQIVIAFKIRPLHRLSLSKNIFMQIQQFLLPSFVCVYII